MVYTDKIHLIADTLEELHSFAANIGMKAEWFQNHKRHPHYDIWGTMLKKALSSGAVVISSKDLVQKANKLNCSLSAVSGCSCDNFNGEAIEKAFTIINLANQMFGGNKNCH